MRLRTMHVMPHDLESGIQDSIAPGAAPTDHPRAVEGRGARAGCSSRGVALMRNQARVPAGNATLWRASGGSYGALTFTVA